MSKTTEQLVVEIHTDMKWVKEALVNKASKWTENVLKLLMAGTGLWVLNQLLGLIETANAVAMTYVNNPLG